MKLLLDADAFIKLRHAGLLSVVVRTFECETTQAVFDEVVRDGRARNHPDADEIGVIIDEFVEVLINVADNYVVRRGLGQGERSLLRAYRQSENRTIVSDDREFQKMLYREGIEYLSPAGVIVLLNSIGTLGVEDSVAALASMRPYISEATYQRALSDLAG